MAGAGGRGHPVRGGSVHGHAGAGAELQGRGDQDPRAQGTSHTAGLKLPFSDTHLRLEHLRGNRQLNQHPSPAQAFAEEKLGAKFSLPKFHVRTPPPSGPAPAALLRSGAAPRARVRRCADGAPAGEWLEVLGLALRGPSGGSDTWWLLRRPCCSTRGGCPSTSSSGTCTSGWRRPCNVSILVANTAPPRARWPGCGVGRRSC